MSPHGCGLDPAVTINAMCHFRHRLNPITILRGLSQQVVSLGMTSIQTPFLTTMNLYQSNGESSVGLGSRILSLLQTHLGTGRPTGWRNPFNSANNSSSWQNLTLNHLRPVLTAMATVFRLMGICDYDRQMTCWKNTFRKSSASLAAVYNDFKWISHQLVASQREMHTQYSVVIVKDKWDGNRYCNQQFQTVASGLGPGPNWTGAKVAVQVIHSPNPSTRVRFNGNLLTSLNWAGFQRGT